MKEAEVNEYELEREQQISMNKRKLQELGLLDLKAPPTAPKPVKRAKKAKEERADGPPASWSFRQRKVVSYKEVQEKLPVERRPSKPRAPPANVDELRSTFAAQQPKQTPRKPIDSGKGVRVQGGRVYDSTYGITCHWCRQKTLEEHVTCTSEGCGKGKRMPTSFCKMCLRNRHGEDAVAASMSGKWVCPCCRVSCGAGCLQCCNCGPCRKKAGLGPTFQVLKLAKEAGFDNVHDYLVFQATGETPEKVAARKAKFAWGEWLKCCEAGTCQQQQQQPEEEEEQGEQGEGEGEAAGEQSDDSAQTASKQRGGPESEEKQEEEEEEELLQPVRPLSRKERALQKIGLLPRFS